MIRRWSGLLWPIVLYGCSPAAPRDEPRPWFGPQPVEAERPSPVGSEAAIERRARFVIEALTLEAINETGFDWAGSDEVIAVFRTPSYSVATARFGNMDSDGEARQFGPANRCIWPARDDDGQRNQAWSCEPDGRPGPVQFIVSLCEHDGPVRRFFNPGFCVFGPTDLASGVCSTDSTVIGHHRMSFTQPELVGAMPSIGDTHTDTIRVDSCSEAVTIRGEICGHSDWWPGYAAYDLTFRITRLSDRIVAPPVQP